MTLILGIESSCDESAAAIVDEHRTILASIVRDQSTLHAGFGGVVPEIAARAHAETLDLVVEEALIAAQVGISEIDAIAVTAGPGLIGGVLAGVMTAKGIAAGAGKPLIAVNHLAGHALTTRLTDSVDFPFLALLVSGGHCQFLAVDDPENYERLGGTIDDAPGEAFDKTARLLGLKQPGGPSVEAAARSGNPSRFEFPRPLKDRPGLDMSFSGLKTAVLRARDEIIASKGGLSAKDRSDIAASFQAAVADLLACKASLALQEAARRRPITSFSVVGGVAANGVVCDALAGVSKSAGIRFVAPRKELCTDNAAMIAWAGAEMFLAGRRDRMDFVARPRWPLDTTSQPMLGSGRKGAKA